MSRSASGRPVVVIGVGNAFRGDDGVGPAVLAALAASDPRGGLLGADLVELDGEASRLVDAWTGAGLAVVVDAVRTGAPPGTVLTVDVDPDAPPASGPAASSHGTGVAEAVALGAALGRLPDRLVVVGVEGARIGDGPGLSPPVAAAVAPAALAVRDVLATGGEG